jgi:hypothetical protein
MREIDFLPDWYPQIQTRYRMVVAQAWVTVAIVAVLVGYVLFKRWQVHSVKVVTAQCLAQISQSQQQLAQLNEKLKYEAQLRRQEQIVARLGLGVETTRLMKALQDAMTPEMALTNLSLETVELAKPGAMSASSSAHRDGKDQTSDVDRRLKVVLDGVEPNDMQLATLLENLSKVKCFENVAFSNSVEGQSRDGHVLREFEVTFEMNLNPPSEVRQ